MCRDGRVSTEAFERVARVEANDIPLILATSVGRDLMRSDAARQTSQTLRVYGAVAAYLSPTTRQLSESGVAIAACDAVVSESAKKNAREALCVGQ